MVVDEVADVAVTDLLTLVEEAASAEITFEGEDEGGEDGLVAEDEEDGEGMDGAAELGGCSFFNPNWLNVFRLTSYSLAFFSHFSKSN